MNEKPITANFLQSVYLPGVVAIVDDDEQISSALKTWFEFGGLQTSLHSSSESLLQDRKSVV